MELAVYMDDTSDRLHEEIVVASGAFGLPEKWFDVERSGIESCTSTVCQTFTRQLVRV
jgi:hypothetical protein